MAQVYTKRHEDFLDADTYYLRHRGTSTYGMNLRGGVLASRPFCKWLVHSKTQNRSQESGARRDKTKKGLYRRLRHSGDKELLVKKIVFSKQEAGFCD